MRTESRGPGRPTDDQGLRFVTSERLKHLRLKRGLTQAALSRELDCLRASVSQWEGGASNISAGRLVRLARYFGCSTDYLLGLRKSP